MGHSGLHYCQRFHHTSRGKRWWVGREGKLRWDPAYCYFGRDVALPDVQQRLGGFDVDLPEHGAYQESGVDFREAREMRFLGRQPWRFSASADVP